MADVQIENGYTKIANEILEALAKTNLNGTQRRIIDVVIRYTYGFQRKEHELSISFIANATGIHKKQLQRELAVIIEKNIITVVREATFTKSRIIQFNKNYDKWFDSRQVTNSLPPNEIDTHTGNELAPSTGNELAPQEINKEKLKETLWKLYPNKKGKQDVKDSHKKEIYKIGYEKMKKAIDNYNEYIEKNKDWYKAMHGGRFFKNAYKDYFESQEQPEEQKSIYKAL